MKIIYRISDSGYNKIKPSYINNENCLKNFCDVFRNHINDITIIADNCSESTLYMIQKYINSINIEKVSVGHGAGTFNIALSKSLEYPDDEIVYFVENDYLHKQGADFILMQSFEVINPSYVTLYDHPDKYMPNNLGGNAFVEEDGGEVTKVYCSGNCHWKLTNSTTMTFAARVRTLKEDESVFKKWTLKSYPEDFQIFLELRDKGRTLISSIPGYSTHGETAWLSPLTDWSNI